MTSSIPSAINKSRASTERRPRSSHSLLSLTSLVEDESLENVGGLVNDTFISPAPVGNLAERRNSNSMIPTVLSMHGCDAKNTLSPNFHHRMLEESRHTSMTSVSSLCG